MMSRRFTFLIVAAIVAVQLIHVDPISSAFGSGPVCRVAPGPVPAWLCRVDITEGDGSTGIGSGVYLGPAPPDSRNGWVATCDHNVARANRLKITVAGSRSTHWATIHKRNPSADLAVLLIARPSIDAWPTVAPDGTPPARQATAYGYRFGRYHAAAARFLGVVQVEGQARGQTLLYAACGGPGMSGGPVVDSQGRLHAIVWGQGGQELAATRAAPLIAMMADEARLTPPAEPATPTPDSAADEPTLADERLRPIYDALRPIREQTEEQSRRCEQLAADHAALGQRVDRIDRRLEILQAEIVGLASLPPIRGPQGPAGPPGIAPEAVAAFEARLAALEAKIEEPIRLEVLGTDGETVSETWGRLGGEPLQLQLEPVNP